MRLMASVGSSGLLRRARRVSAVGIRVSHGEAARLSWIDVGWSPAR
jgi:hypothetical protein